MQVDYYKLFDMIKAKGMTKQQFKDVVGVKGTTYQNLINNESVTVNTICKICDYFDCMPDDIMEWIPKSECESYNKNAEQRKIERQIAELQRKLAETENRNA